MLRLGIRRAMGAVGGGCRWGSSVSRNPREVGCVPTKYGWFIVPKKAHIPRWTSSQLEKTIDEQCADWDDLSVDKLQLVVDVWSLQLLPKDIPKLERVTGSQRRQQEADALYKLQLREDMYEATTTATDTADVPSKTKSVAKKKSTTVNYRHAWNYFFSLMFHKYKKEGTTKKELTDTVKNAWNELNAEDKERYRKDYENLIASGHDIYRSKIVTIEEKLALTRKGKKKKKGTQPEPEK